MPSACGCSAIETTAEKITVVTAIETTAEMRRMVREVFISVAFKRSFWVDGLFALQSVPHLLKAGVLHL